MILSLAPLQGFTEFPIRNAFNKIIGGIDKFYTPYLKVENDGNIRNKFIRDVLPENNPDIQLIPQILVNNAEDFKKLHDIIKPLGYDEINLNLGCPYPMVANRNLGSGLLPQPKILQELFDYIFSTTELKISVKFRSGYQSDQEIFELIDQFNSYPFHELIYHPRIGKQLYKGIADIAIFNRVNDLANKNLTYNGDVSDLQSYENITVQNKTLEHVMIGRGLLKNPFLAQEIKQQKIVPVSEKQSKFFALHEEIFSHYINTLSGDSHVLNKMKPLWEYISHLFEDQHEVHKLFKKCKNLKKYELLIQELKNYRIKQI